MDLIEGLVGAASYDFIVEIKGKFERKRWEMGIWKS